MGLQGTRPKGFDAFDRYSRHILHMFGDVSKQNVASSTDISISSVPALRTYVSLLSLQFAIDPATAVACFARVVLSDDDDSTLRIFLGLKNQSLPKSKVDPVVHHASSLAADASFLTALGHVCCLELRN